MTANIGQVINLLFISDSKIFVCWPYHYDPKVHQFSSDAPCY